jgi:general secretion pathway protein H
MRPARGFTLLELLVVLVIAGLTLGMVSFNAMPSERQVLQKESQRIALLLQLARDEAIVRNRPIAFEADSQGYHFLMREENVWQLLTQDELLRDRQFQRPPVAVSISPPQQQAGLRVVFGREPVDKPFLMTLSSGESSAAIRADGIGHFVVE